jgi:hypothetical protein
MEARFDKLEARFDVMEARSLISFQASDAGSASRRDQGRCPRSDPALSSQITGFVV